MKKYALFLLLTVILSAAQVNAGSIQYIGTGRTAPKVKVTFSRNNGATWEHKEVKAGQTFNFPKDTTHLRIDNVPFDPKRNYKVKEGNVY